MITCNTVTLYLPYYINYLQRPFFPKEQLDPQQGVRGVFECVGVCARVEAAAFSVISVAAFGFFITRVLVR